MNGHGGDEGIDAYLGPFETPTVIFQFKFFRETFGVKQVRQIKDSLERALSRRSGFKWVLMCSADPTPDAQRALDELKETYAAVEIEYLFGSSIRAWLIETPKVRKEYYPNTHDHLEAISLMDGHNPIDMIWNGTKRLNDVGGDDRFKTTVIADESSLTTVYELRPTVKESVPIFRVKSKTRRGYEALMALYRDGSPFALTPEDIEFKPLAGLPNNFEKCSIIRACSIPEQRPSLLALYPGAVDDEARPFFVMLKTVRHGVEIAVRSNADQDGCPVFIELKCPMPSYFDAEQSTMRLDIRPSYIGCSVKEACRGARFFKQLGKSGRLGLCVANGDPEEVTYCTLSESRDCGEWEKQLAFFDALKRVCDFFGVNPIVDESIGTEAFACTLNFIIELIDNANKELQGAISFSLVNVDEERLKKSDDQAEARFVTDETVRIDLLGIHCEAAMRIVSKGKLSYEKNSEGYSCQIIGTHIVYIEPKTREADSLALGDSIETIDLQESRWLSLKSHSASRGCV